MAGRKRNHEDNNQEGQNRLQGVSNAPVPSGQVKVSVVITGEKRWLKPQREIVKYAQWIFLCMPPRLRASPEKCHVCFSRAHRGVTSLERVLMLKIQGHTSEMNFNPKPITRVTFIKS